MTTLSIDELKQSIAELKERNRQIRIEQGKPPEPPEDFVSVPLSIVLAKRVQPFIRIAVKYLAILAEGTVHRIDTARFAEYREYAVILSESKGTFCKFKGGNVIALLRIMDEVNDSADISDADIARLVRNGSFFVGLTARDVQLDIPTDVDYDVSKRVREEMTAEVKLLESDPVAFQTAYDEARAHYETIKHLI